MRPYQNVNQYTSNLKKLARQHGALASLAGMARPSTRLVIGDTGALNVDIGGGNLLYPDDARAAVARQVETFLDQPSRCFCVPDDVMEGGVEVNWVFRGMRDAMARFPTVTPQSPYAGFLVIFGVGLGYHVRMLAERLTFKTLIVVEVHDEFLIHSFHALDWAGFAQGLARSGRELHFVRGGDLYAQIVSIINSEKLALLDGSYLYAHYQAPEYQDLIDRLFFRMKDLSMLPGWVEDQLLLMKNSTENFAVPGYGLQQSRVGSARALPAFVVGAGPSLDNDIEEIRRCRENVILVTASSGLKVMLDHGIRPDIHCELENGAGLGDVAETLSAKYDLSGIVLYATPTVDPRIAPCFREVVYFFRSGLSSTSFYGKGAEQTALAEPTSGNTAVYCALSLGFREIYLFGLDYGARDPEMHHSRHSVYFTYEDEAELATYTSYDLDRAVPANFGGNVMSGWLLQMGQEVIAQAIRRQGNVRVMNCSDGCRIGGTTPLASEAMDIALAPLSRDADLRAALAELSQMHELPRPPDDLLRLKGRLRGFADDWLAAVERLDPSNPDPQMAAVSLFDDVIARLRALRGEDEAAYGILTGHVQAVLAALFHHASRLAPRHGEAGLLALKAILTEAVGRLYPLFDMTFGVCPIEGIGVLSPEE